MNEHANGDVMTDPTAPFDRAGIEQRQARRLGLRRFERGAIQLDLDEAEADLRAALQELDRLNEPIDLEVRLTSRLLNHLKAAIAHGVKHVNHDYPGSVNIERIGSVEKRVSGAVWSILRQHPDVRYRAGKFEDELRQQLITSEVECAKRSVMIGELRAEAGALRQERDSLQARIDVLEPPARSYNRTLARAEHAEQQLAKQLEELEQLHVQLAGCSTAALGLGTPPVERGAYGWSQSYSDVLQLRQQLATLRAALERIAAHDGERWRYLEDEVEWQETPQEIAKQTLVSPEGR